MSISTGRDSERAITDIKLIPSLSDKFEKVEEWPSFSITLELAPWFWRVGWYSCRGDGHFFILYLGPVRIHLWS